MLRLLCGFGEFGVDVFVVVGCGFVAGGGWETADMGELGGQFDGRVLDWREAAAAVAVV